MHSLRHDSCYQTHGLLPPAVQGQLKPYNVQLKPQPLILPRHMIYSLISVPTTRKFHGYSRSLCVAIVENPRDTVILCHIAGVVEQFPSMKALRIRLGKSFPRHS